MRKNLKKSNNAGGKAITPIRLATDTKGNSLSVADAHFHFSSRKLPELKYFESFYQFSPQPVLIYLQHDQPVVYANAALHALFELKKNADITLVIDFAQDELTISRLKNKPKPGEKGFSTEFRLPSGKILHLHWQRAYLLFNEKHYIQVFVSDQTAAVAIEAKKLLGDALKLAFQEGKSLREKLKKAVAAIRQAANWDLAELWLYSKESNSALLEAHACKKKTAAIRKFLNDSQKLNSPQDLIDTMPIRESLQSVWIENLHQDNTIFRAKAAAAAGLRSAIVIPLLENGQCAGGLFLFHSQACTYNAELMQMLEPATGQLNDAINENRAMEEMQSFFQLSGELLCLLDLKGTIRKVNLAFCNLLGFTDEELIGKAFFDLVHADDLAKTQKLLAAPFRKKKIRGFENRFLSRGQEYKWLSWSFTYSTDHQVLVCAARDMTDIRTSLEKLEAAEQRYAAFLNHSSEAIWRIELPGGVSVKKSHSEIMNKCAAIGFLAECNLAFAKTYGYATAEEMKGMRLDEIMPVSDPGNLAYMEMFIRSGFNLNNAESLELDRGGNRKFILNNLIGIVEKGRLWRIWGMQRDITEIKLAEKEIQRREEQFRTLAENVPAMIHRVDNSFRITYVNKAVKQTFNPDAELAYLGKTPGELGMHPESWKILKERGERVLSTGLSDSFTLKIPSARSTGKEFNLLIHLAPELDESGKSQSMIAIGTEISKLVQAQDALIYKDRLLSVIADSAQLLLKNEDYRSAVPDILSRLGQATSSDRVYLFENSRSRYGDIVSSQVFEWCASDCEPQIDNPELQEIPISFFADEFAELEEGTCFWKITEKISNPEMRRLLQKQKIRAILIVPIFVNNEFWGFIGFDDCKSNRNWNEVEKTSIKTVASSLASAIGRQRSEAVILESEARFRHMADSAPVMIWVSDEQDNTVYVNKSWMNFTGITFGELHRHAWSSLVHPDDLKPSIRRYDELYRRQLPVEMEYRLRAATGEFRWVIDQASPRFLSDGTFLGYIGSVIDIHDRKVSEEKLSYQAHVMQEINESIISTDMAFNVLTWNKGAELLHNMESSAILGRSLLEEVEYHFINETREEVLQHLFNYGFWGGELIYDRPDERRLFLQTSISFIGNNRNDRIGIVVVQRDITDKRKSEDALRISEERYRSVVNALGEGILLQDEQGNVITCNKSAEQILGFTAEQMKNGREMARRWNSIHEDGSFFPASQQPGMITLQTGRSLQNIIMGVHKFNGALTWISINTEPLYYSEQRLRPDAVVVSFIDITEKKTAEIELQQNERQLREYSERIKNILDSITDGFIAVDNDLNVFLWNKVLEKETGIRSIEAMGRPISEVFLQDAAGIHEQFRATIEQKRTLVQEHYSESGNNWLEITSFPSAQGLFIYFRDINRRKLHESLIALEKEALELNARPQSNLKQIIMVLLRGIEQIYPGTLSSVLGLQDDGRTIETIAAPNLPVEYSAAIDGVRIGPKVGSCGTAMYLKQNILVDDISTSELWENYRELALSHGLMACWSFPILSSQNKVLASFAIYHKEICLPDEDQLRVLERAVNILRIIIENKQSEEKIKVSNERYLLATMATNDAIWDWDVSTNYMYWGEGFHALFGYKAGYFNNELGMWESAIHPQDRDRVVPGLHQFIASNSQQVWQEEYRFRKSDGKYVLVADRGFLIYNQQGQVSRMVGSMQDISEKREMEKKLLRQQLNRQKLVAQAVVEAQEKERSLIGKELHDNVNQILSTAKLYLEVAKNDEKDRASFMEMSVQGISDAINEIRTISRSLVPSSIGDLGLVVSIQDLVESIKLTRRLHVEFYHHEHIDQLMSEQQKLMLFRITQEQVNNVIKHANATNLVIELVADDDTINISISDDGQGFDPDQVKQKKGVGLSNITSRAELFNGKVHIDTAPGKGCTMNIYIPISNL